MTRSNITITHGFIASLGLFVLFSMPASAASPLSYDAVEEDQDRENEEALDADAEEDLDADAEEDLDADEEDLDAVEDDDHGAEDENELEDADGTPSSLRAKPDAMARESPSGGCSVNPRDGAPGMAVLALLGLLGLRRRSRHSLAA